MRISDHKQGTMDYFTGGSIHDTNAERRRGWLDAQHECPDFIDNISKPKTLKKRKNVKHRRYLTKRPMKRRKSNPAE